MFFNKLSPDGNSPVQYCENLQLPIQMQVSEKWKTCSQFYVPFHVLESRSNLKYFRKKMMIIANMFPKSQTVQNFVTPLCKKCCFQIRLDSRHMQVSRILSKSPRECFYHLFSSICGKLIFKLSPLVLGEI